MNIKYYSELKVKPSQSTWNAMNNCLSRYVMNANFADRLLRDIFSKMCTFAERNELQLESKEEIKRILKQKESQLTYDVTEWSDVAEWNIDILPLYE